MSTLPPSTSIRMQKKRMNYLYKKPKEAFLFWRDSYAVALDVFQPHKADLTKSERGTQSLYIWYIFFSWNWVIRPPHNPGTRGLKSEFWRTRKREKKEGVCVTIFCMKSFMLLQKHYKSDSRLLLERKT